MATKNNVDIPMDTATLNYHELVDVNKNHNIKRQKRYTVLHSKWDTTNLTYRLALRNLYP